MSPTVTLGRWAALGKEVTPLDKVGRRVKRERVRVRVVGRSLLNCWPGQLLQQGQRHLLRYHHHRDRPHPHTVPSRAGGRVRQSTLVNTLSRGSCADLSW